MSFTDALRAQIRQLATLQLGYVTRYQLLELGAGPSWIRDQIRLGHLIPVHAGVCAVGHVPRHAHCRAMAAVLACGDGAALSHWAAAALWEVADWPATLEVSAPKNRCRPGLLTHRSRTLTPHELRTRHGVRVTSPVRTVLDLQPRLTDTRLIRLVNVRLRIGGRMRQLDALYREPKLIIELDSWRFHADRSSFERDRTKDAVALAEGFRTLRSTDRRLRAEGREEAQLIRRILADSPPGHRSGR